MTGRVLVIADDFTGAAEIAGIGSRFGLDVEILRRPPFDSTSQMVVIDTDSRSLPAADAAHSVREVLSKLPIQTFNLIFKKIDSVLRGPVAAEIQAAMQALGRRGVILCPANPSRGRTIRGGKYFVKGLPLHQTEMADDPEHPRRSSRIDDLIGPAPAGVTVADASSRDDVAGWAARIDAQTLPVGAADFFSTLLAKQASVVQSPTGSLGDGRMLLVCGTAAPSSRENIAKLAARGVRVLTPEDHPALRDDENAIVTSGAVGSGPERHSALPRLAKFVVRVLEMNLVDELLIEGGATSAAVLDAMDRHRFHDCMELAPGVVRMSVGGTGMHATVKPGSYPWPQFIWTRISTGVIPGAQ